MFLRKFYGAQTIRNAHKICITHEQLLCMNDLLLNLFLNNIAINYINDKSKTNCKK